MNDLYINLGSKKSCLFVKMSIFLVRVLEKHPLLYYAVEEALECAKLGYYGIGIVTFSQLLNLIKKETPKSRHIVAHEVLMQRPTKDTFDIIVESFRIAASEHSQREIAKSQSIEEYHQKITRDWKALIKNLHGIEINVQPIAAPDRPDGRPES